MADERIDRVLRVLGGSSVLGKGIHRPEDLRNRVRQGLPYDSLEHLLRQFRVSLDKLERTLALSERTRARRKRSGTLSATESDRLYRTARILSLTAEALGDAGKASRWLEAPNRSLGNQKPLELLDTEIGARAVEDAIGRIEHGIFS
jgi:putative toxin-antitoxin system antitoxin component (TIGR02293 family)